MKPILRPTSLAGKDGFVVIDARGHRCPVPTLKLRRQMERTHREGGVILWANDPMAQIDVPHFCNQNNYVILSTEVMDEAWCFTIEHAAR
ncbi:MAG TPA: sulfurtransferase TusA family protein [Asticcacaulis sp.]|nr:sulfurtransferase TusA family protein [Asticcacaulis sp.]